VILLVALAAGLLVGLVWARLRGYPYQAPELSHLWLVFVAFLPQLIVIYLPNARSQFSDWLVVGFLLASQILLFGFAWLNRRIPGMPILICGVVLNLAVMASNSGFMPISPQTASHLVSKNGLLDIQLGSRIGEKDILLRPQDTRFEWLADRFLTPAWFPYQAAFSLGDVFIAIGAFWMLAKPGSPMQFMTRGTQK
jgi:hypothetical protein